MSADDSGAQPRSNESAADIAALEHDVQLLHEIRDGLATQAGSEVFVEAVTGMIEERRADLERFRHPTKRTGGIGAPALLGWRRTHRR